MKIITSKTQLVLFSFLIWNLSSRVILWIWDPEIKNDPNLIYLQKQYERVFEGKTTQKILRAKME